MTCAHCAELEEELAFLRSELALQVDWSSVETIKRAFSLSPMQARLLLVLYASHGRVMSCFQIEEAMPKVHRQGDAAQYVKSQVSFIRKKLGHEFITTSWGMGFVLPPASRAILAELIEPQKVAA